MKFKTMRTKHQTYIKIIADRFTKVRDFTAVPSAEKDQTEFFSEKEELFYEAGKSKASQLIQVGNALGFFKEKGDGTYTVVCTEYNYQKVTEAIFSPSADKAVADYRYSRVISCLWLLDLPDFFDFTKNIKRRKGNAALTKEQIMTEVSLWENDTAQSGFTTAQFMKKVKENEHIWKEQ